MQTSRRLGRPPVTAEQRFWAKVIKTDRCWLWIGYVRSDGYANFMGHNGAPGYAHRFSYELARGPVPPGLHLDHLCRVRHCVNPDHLEAVTPRVNTLRGVGPSALNAGATHCVRGHEFTPENTLRYPSSPEHRVCKICAVDNSARQYAARPKPSGYRPKAGRTHCPRGHEYTPANLIVRRGRTGKDCRECARMRDRRRTKCRTS